MKILSLNCRGLGIPEAVQELRCLISEEGPKILFLFETKLERDGFRRLKRKINFQNGFEVPRIGLGGGLALLWRDNVDVDVQTSSPHHIDALINQNRVVWRFIGFYGHLDTSQRGESWELMRQLNTPFSLLWLLLGDFNEIFHPNEYCGSGSRPYNQIVEFTRAVDDCSLIDLGFSGPKYTWCNRRFEGNLVYARLDRGLYNLEWLNLFPHSKLPHKPFGFFDHMALVAKLHTSAGNSSVKKHRFFQFEAFWMRDPKCEDIIRSSWDTIQWGTPMFRLTQKIKAVRVALLQWGGSNARGLIQSISEKMNLLTSLELELASQRRRSNEIQKLQDVAGNCHTQQTDLERIVTDYFQTMFTSASTGSFHQIVSNVFANRLKQILGEIISECQSAFVVDKVITDNILISFETLHYMKSKRQGNIAHIAFKLDMRISTVSYSVLVNGVPSGFIRPSRGIRGGPQITHLLFADDSLLFGNASISECRTIKEIITSIFFSTNTPLSLREDIRLFLNATANEPLEKYLGLPPIIGRGKKQAFADNKNRIQSKLCSWKGELLSQEGREVLIKSVAQAIPVYPMNCFLLPMSFCDEINSMMGQFCWGQKNEEKKLYWLSWKHLCLAKKDGGLGFRDLRSFNLALLAKQCWRLLHNQDSLFYQVYKAKYFPNTSFLEAAVPTHSLYAWRSITHGQHLIVQGSRWRVGDGSLINIWADKWLPFEINQKFLS
ncbi:uncharacterized protein LOC142625348 [Castanea sativa]|uniref:uncharacterized protein LOC142625348 n=1 Tax=Castanea sativa TaxID=21020 RepID=UPI003F64B21E